MSNFQRAEAFGRNQELHQQLIAAAARAEAAETQGFHAGIISALAILRLHGAETIWQEVVDLCDTQALLAHAAANDEVEFSGLDKWLPQGEEVQP